jgi:hypothetical protein
MIGFAKETWRRLRTPNEKGGVLSWPLAAITVAFVSLFYGIIAFIKAMFGWLWRLVRPRRSGGSPDDRPGGAFFNSSPPDHSSGTGGVSNFMGGNGSTQQSVQQTAQPQQPSAHQMGQSQIAQQRAMERAWEEEMEMRGMPPEYYDDDPFGEGLMFDQRHPPARHEAGRRGGSRYRDIPPDWHDPEMGYYPQHQHRHRQHRRNGRRRRFHRGGSPRMQISFG